MKLLLLLSALLAALSGAGAQARLPQSRFVEAAAQVAAPVAEPAHAHVLLTARPTVARIAGTDPVIGSFDLCAPSRLWMQRRRE